MYLIIKISKSISILIFFKWIFSIFEIYEEIFPPRMREKKSVHSEEFLYLLALRRAGDNFIAYS